MSRKFFGTDGIRGQANDWPMTSEIALRVGMAAGRTYTRGDHRHRVVIGKDTRLSGYMIESALVSGFTAVGMDVFQFGPVPTPAVAMLTRSLRADMGVMISASHNKFSDNGIKLFGPDGYKLSDEKEMEIEALMQNGVTEHLAEPERLGRAKRIDDSQARYIESAKRTLPRYFRLEGLKVVVDCANGAAYRVAPTALWELGAEVIAIGVDPNGFNINKDCGSTSLDLVRKRVVEEGADLGIALDGDADRVMIIDEKGKVIDGDQIMGLIASHWAKEDLLQGGSLVATVMSNLGLERYLSAQNINLVRTQVGDRYVMEHMRENNCNLGGEQSGHIIMSDYGTTGDGLVAALQVMKIVKQQGKPASEVCDLFETVPQLLKNVQYKNESPLEDAEVQAAILEAENRLEKSGRLLIRPSGTEPLIRVMAEGDDSGLVEEVVDGLVSLIAKKAG